MSEPQWFYAVGQQQCGPVTREQLQQMANAGQLAPGQLVWSAGMPAWMPAGTVPGLFALAAAPLAYATPYDPTPTILRNARVNCIGLFVTFWVCLAMRGMCWQESLQRGHLDPASSVYTWAVLSFLIMPAGLLFGLIYLPVRWKYVRQLPASVRRMGVVGVAGLGVLVVASIVLGIVL